MSLKETISSLDFFSKLNDDDIQKLSLFSSLHKYKKNYILYFEKQSTSKLFFMVSGQAKAYKLDKNNNEIIKKTITSYHLSLFTNHLCVAAVKTNIPTKDVIITTIACQIFSTPIKRSS